MSMNDPISDMLTRIRNGKRASKRIVEIPFSNVKMKIAEIMKEEGYLESVSEKVLENNKKNIIAKIKYVDNNTPVISDLQRVSRPGLRVYKGYKNIPRVLNNLGIAIVSTPKGLLTDYQARKLKVGGEIICNVW